MDPEDSDLDTLKGLACDARQLGLRLLRDLEHGHAAVAETITDPPMDWGPFLRASPRARALFMARKREEQRRRSQEFAAVRAALTQELLLLKNEVIDDDDAR